MKFKSTLLLLLTCMGPQLFAQSTTSETNIVTVGSDITSSYLWRAIPQGTGPAIQPWGDISYHGVSVGTWGSYELTGNFKEIDVYAKYTYRSLTLQVVDLFFPDYPGLNQNYLNFKKESTGHAAEIGFSFNGTEDLPFSLFTGVIAYGRAIDPKPNDPQTNNHSAYLELNYLGTTRNLSYNVFAGMTPTSSSLYGTSGFSVFNIGVSAKKNIDITARFSVPFKLTLALNPNKEKLNLSASISL